MKKKEKKNERILLLPGSGGWEAWRGVNGDGLSLAERSEAARPLDLERIPSGELAMAFPVRDVSSLPFRAPTTDEALFGDMAEMHIERLGMQPEVDAGVLSDYFKVGATEGESLLQPVVLAPPIEGSLPKRSPKIFDVSARCLPLPAEGIVLWRELGRWVFAVAKQGHPLHFQALAAPNLGAEAGRELKLAMTQLLLQEVLEALPDECLVWVEEEDVMPAREEMVALGESYGGGVTLMEKPAPVIPPVPSHLLPADVRAERAAKRKRQQTTLMAASAAVLYLGTIGWFAWSIIQQKRANDVIQAQVDELVPLVSGIDQHYKKWDELQPVTELEHWPVELLWNSTAAIPKSGGLRLTRAEILNQLSISDQGVGEMERSIRLQGQAEEFDQANMFNLNLKESAALDEYFWTTPPPVEDTKSGRWSFIYSADHNPDLAAGQ